jgi:transposase
MDLDIKLFRVLLRLEGIEIEKVEMDADPINVYCKKSTPEPRACPRCKCLVSRCRPKYRREVRDLDISGRQVYLHLQVHQYECDCGRTFSEQFDFVSSGKSYTKRQAKYVFELSAKQSHLQAGAISGMCHKTVERICYEMVEAKLQAVDWSSVFRIGIDEFAFRKGHKDFVVTLVNLDTGDILEILENREKSFLRTYFQSLGSGFLNQVKEFCSDMWGPFQDLGKELFPNALIHVDRFHWTVHLNKALDDYRKSLRRHTDSQVFKGLKWKLIKRPENLNATEMEALNKALQEDKTLNSIYGFRNEFLHIFDTHSSMKEAVEKVNAWLEKVVKFNNKYLTKFVELFERHRNQIMNYFKTRLSSAAVEGKNNLLRTVKRFTFNMSNFKNFRQRVFAYNLWFFDNFCQIKRYSLNYKDGFRY